MNYIELIEGITSAIVAIAGVFVAIFSVILYLEKMSNRNDLVRAISSSDENVKEKVVSNIIGFWGFFIFATFVGACLNAINDVYMSTIESILLIVVLIAFLVFFILIGKTEVNNAMKNKQKKDRIWLIIFNVVALLALYILLFSCMILSFSIDIHHVSYEDVILLSVFAFVFSTSFLLYLSKIDKKNKALFKICNDNDENDCKYLYYREGDIFILGDNELIDNCKEYYLWDFDKLKACTVKKISDDKEDIIDIGQETELAEKKPNLNQKEKGKETKQSKTVSGKKENK